MEYNLYDGKSIWPFRYHRFNSMMERLGAETVATEQFNDCHVWHLVAYGVTVKYYSPLDDVAITLFGKKGDVRKAARVILERTKEENCGGPGIKHQITLDELLKGMHNVGRQLSDMLFKGREENAPIGTALRGKKNYG